MKDIYYVYIYIYIHTYIYNICTTFPKSLSKKRAFGYNGGIIEWEWGSDEGTALARSVAWEPTDENSLHLFATKSKKWAMLTVSYGFATTNLFTSLSVHTAQWNQSHRMSSFFFSKVLGTAQVFGLKTSRHISLLSFACSSFHSLSEKNEVSNLWPCQFRLNAKGFTHAPPNNMVQFIANLWFFKCGHNGCRSPPLQLFWSHPILTVQVHQWDEQKPALQSIDVWLQLTHCATLFIRTVYYGKYSGVEFDSHELYIYIYILYIYLHI